MKAFDRIAGQETELPATIEAGRYAVLHRTSFNRTINLSPADIILTDGSQNCTLGESAFNFTSQAFNAEQESAAEMAAQAIRILAARATELPSPLIPSEMADLAELNELDHCLARIIDKGHLHEIAKKPRFSMKYDEEVVQTGRVQRMASGAVRRLSAHSEDWHRRTISGVLPSRLLALLSEDEWSIYENRVFARLLDRLDAYLRKKLREATLLKKQYDEALQLAGTESMYFRLSHRLCELWGSAMTTEATKKALEKSTDSIAALEHMRQRVSRLRQSELYARVPRSAQVPAQLRHTNILLHDQHYRHLRTLWHLHQKHSGESKNTPEEIYAANRKSLEDFTTYLHMMFARILSGLKSIDRFDARHGSFDFAGGHGQLSIGPYQTITLQADSRQLTIVPMLNSAISHEQALNQDGSGRLVIACLDREESAEGTECDPDTASDVLVINPFKFYGEEKLRLIIERFLWHPLFASYAQSIERLPSGVLAELASRNWGLVTEGRWQLQTPIPPDQMGNFESWLVTSSMNPESKNRFRQAVAHLKTLSTCRYCNGSAVFNARQNRQFLASCTSCGMAWARKGDPNSWSADIRPVDDASLPTFKTHGAWAGGV